MKTLPIVESNRGPAAASVGRVDVSGAASTSRGNYAFVSLGCPKNLVDSERMLGLLEADGFRLVSEPQQSDFVVINTCGFIDSARKESFDAIDQMLELKRSGVIRGVIVTGCLAERQQEALLEARPDIDAMAGVFGREQIAELAARLGGGLHEQRMVFRPAPVRALPDTNRLRVTPRHFSYLKISEGCDRLCTFCAIPKMRGKHASKPMEGVLEEAHQLASDGVRELIIVAQDTTYYGLDLYGQARLAELLEQLDQVPGIDWIRLMYFYPMYIDDRLIDVLANSQHIIPYIDMPLQHANDVMLRRMARRVNRSDTELLLEKMRSRIDHLVMRTTFITGFPGETDEQFQDLVDFVETQAFERVGVFTYSLEPDTPAAKLPGHLPEPIKQQRREELMRVQQRHAFGWAERQVGKRRMVLLDKPLDAQCSAWIGRTYADAPDVDPVVYVTAQPGVPLKAGDMVACEIVAHNDYDLVGVATA
jgi:ribosomal protein S12 methylthiotransferase